MSLYKPSELKQFLEANGLKAKKGLSQNFLIDGNILRKIIETAQINADDHVLEIGPGPGVLTEALLETGAFVVAVEKDTKLAHLLHRFNSPKLHVIEGDCLEVEVESHLTKPAKCVANIPYHLTAPILGRFLPMNHLFSSITLLMQLEVAERLVALPKTKAYSSISVFTQFYSRPRIACIVKPECFHPKPKVSSAVVHMELSSRASEIAPLEFQKIVRRAFNQKRKMLTSSLREMFPLDLIKKALSDTNLLMTARPQELSVDAFIAFSNALLKAE